MNLSISSTHKPTQAKWLAKANVTPDGDVVMYESVDADLARVEIAWYESGTIKVTVRNAGPMQISQFYGTGDGKDVIAEFVAK